MRQGQVSQKCLIMINKPTKEFPRPSPLPALIPPRSPCPCGRAANLATDGVKQKQKHLDTLIRAHPRPPPPRPPLHQGTFRC